MPLSFDATVGPLLVFVCIAFMLYGIFVAQLYYYYITYEGDATALKSYVWIMGLLETSHTVLCLIFLYWYLIVRFGDAANGVERIHWSIRRQAIFDDHHAYGLHGANAVLLAHLAWSVVLTAIPVFLSSMRLVLGLTSYILMADLGTWQMVLDDRPLKGTLTATYTVELVADATISAMLIYGLWKRRAASFARSNDVIQRLMFYILNTGTSNIICSAAVIITFNIVQESLAFAGIIEMRSKLYANIMMALLNARQIIFINRDIPLPGLMRNSRNRETRVQIYTDTVIHNDSNDVYGGNDNDVKSTPIIGKDHVEA
ncbi:hypothetical protein BDY19DRAFT_990307 [Irpex rosettiformis]|uniref:Uncharacterized protein n=1 Tax=Irpex rosettiformis TaxID=378272 RepID=A0ACB8UEC1_9APHY|nr:hypothetical protein BDY19DRAFT_990307 [Irpex rosettiformis]